MAPIGPLLGAYKGPYKAPLRVLVLIKITFSPRPLWISRFYFHQGPIWYIHIWYPPRTPFKYQHNTIWYCIMLFIYIFRYTCHDLNRIAPSRHPEGLRLHSQATTLNFIFWENTKHIINNKVKHNQARSARSRKSQ